MEAITPDQLAEFLREAGYELQKRTLLSWAEKGLLPKLTDHGRGRAAGKIYQWEDEDLLERAVNAAWAMDRYKSIDRALFALWIFGFEIEPSEARRAWKSKIRGELSMLRRLTRRFRGYDYVLRKLMREIEKGQARVSTSRTDRTDAVGELGRFELTRSLYRPDDEEIEAEYQIDLFEDSVRENGGGEIRPEFRELSVQVLKVVLWVLKDLLPIRNRMRLVDHSSDQELEEIRCFMCDLRKEFHAYFGRIGGPFEGNSPARFGPVLPLHLLGEGAAYLSLRLNSVGLRTFLKGTRQAALFALADTIPSENDEPTMTKTAKRRFLSRIRQAWEYADVDALLLPSIGRIVGPPNK